MGLRVQSMARSESKSSDAFCSSDKYRVMSTATLVMHIERSPCAERNLHTNACELESNGNNGMRGGDCTMLMKSVGDQISSLRLFFLLLLLSNE